VVAIVVVLLAAAGPGALAAGPAFVHLVFAMFDTKTFSEL